MKFEVDEIQAIIYIIRGQRVMIDSDLAKLYGVEAKRLKEQVKRNIDRFPSDFMIEPNLSDHNHVFKYTPYLFTENGVAMLSSVLQSKQAIHINISIMRTFTKLRSFYALESSLKEEVGQFKKETNQLFKIVFEKLDKYEEQLVPKLAQHRKKIGLKSDQSKK